MYKNFNITEKEKKEILEAHIPKVYKTIDDNGEEFNVYHGQVVHDFKRYYPGINRYEPKPEPKKEIEPAKVNVFDAVKFTVNFTYPNGSTTEMSMIEFYHKFPNVLKNYTIERFDEVMWQKLSTAMDAYKDMFNYKNKFTMGI
jgi:hypothetical protein